MYLLGSHIGTAEVSLASSRNFVPTWPDRKMAEDAVSVTVPVTAEAETVMVWSGSISLNGPPLVVSGTSENDVPVSRLRMRGAWSGCVM